MLGPAYPATGKPCPGLRDTVRSTERRSAPPATFRVTRSSVTPGSKTAEGSSSESPLLRDGPRLVEPHEHVERFSPESLAQPQPPNGFEAEKDAAEGMDPPLVPDRGPSAPGQPGDGPLHHPAVPANSHARLAPTRAIHARIHRRCWSRRQRGMPNTVSAWPFTGRFRSWPPASGSGEPHRAGARGRCCHGGPPRSGGGATGRPMPIDDQVPVGVPGFARSTGVGPVATPPCWPECSCGPG